MINPVFLLNYGNSLSMRYIYNIYIYIGINVLGIILYDVMALMVATKL